MRKHIYFIDNSPVKYELVLIYLEDFKILNHNVKTASKSIDWFRFVKRLNSVHHQCKLGTLEGFLKLRYSAVKNE